MRRLALAVALLLGAAAASAQDYEREKRWAAEVKGNLVVGDAVSLSAGGREFLGLHTAGAAGKPAILLVHGLGVHPDHSVIGVLRVALSDMGYSTLSIQMPVLASTATGQDYYPKLFPEAAARIAAGLKWLGDKGHAKPVLLSHSLGSWMAEFFLDSGPPRLPAGWICLGRGGALEGKALRVPTLDAYGEKDLPQVLKSAEARAAALAKAPGSRQHVVAGADHFFNGREAALAAAIREFVEGLR